MSRVGWRAIAVVGLLLFAACGADFDPPTKITKLRMLGVRFEPPVVRVGDPVRAKALIVDEDGVPADDLIVFWGVVGTGQFGKSPNFEDLLASGAGVETELELPTESQLEFTDGLALLQVMIVFGRLDTPPHDPSEFERLVDEGTLKLAMRTLPVAESSSVATQFTNPQISGVRLRLADGAEFEVPRCDVPEQDCVVDLSDSKVSAKTKLKLRLLIDEPTSEIDVAWFSTVELLNRRIPENEFVVPKDFSGNQYPVYAVVRSGLTQTWCAILIKF